MPIQSDPQIAAQNAARKEQQRVKHQDINSDWLDNMVARPFLTNSDGN